MLHITTGGGSKGGGDSPTDTMPMRTYWYSYSLQRDSAARAPRLLAPSDKTYQ